MIKFISQNALVIDSFIVANEMVGFQGYVFLICLLKMRYKENHHRKKLTHFNIIYIGKALVLCKRHKARALHG